MKQVLTDKLEWYAAVIEENQALVRVYADLQKFASEEFSEKLFELDELKNKIYECFSDQKAKNQKSSDQFVNVFSILESLKSLNDSLRNEISEKSFEIKNLKNVQAEYKKEVNGLQKKLEKKDKEINEFSNNLVFEMLRNKSLSKVSSKNEIINQSSDNFHGKKNDFSSIISKFEIWKSEMEKLKNEKLERDAELKMLKSKIENFNKTKLKKENSIGDLQLQIDLKNENIKVLECEKLAKEKIFNDFQKKIENLKRESENTIKNHNLELKTIRKKHSDERDKDFEEFEKIKRKMVIDFEEQKRLLQEKYDEEKKNILSRHQDEIITIKNSLTDEKYLVEANKVIKDLQAENRELFARVETTKTEIQLLIQKHAYEIQKLKDDEFKRLKECEKKIIRDILKRKVNEKLDSTVQDSMTACVEHILIIDKLQAEIQSLKHKISAEKCTKSSFKEIIEAENKKYLGVINDLHKKLKLYMDENDNLKMFSKSNNKNQNECKNYGNIELFSEISNHDKEKRKSLSNHEKRNGINDEVSKFTVQNPYNDKQKIDHKATKKSSDTKLQDSPKKILKVQNLYKDEVSDSKGNLSTQMPLNNQYSFEVTTRKTELKNNMNNKKIKMNKREIPINTKNRSVGTRMAKKTNVINMSLYESTNASNSDLKEDINFIKLPKKLINENSKNNQKENTVNTITKIKDTIVDQKNICEQNEILLDFNSDLTIKSDVDAPTIPHPRRKKISGKKIKRKQPLNLSYTKRKLPDNKLSEKIPQFFNDLTFGESSSLPTLKKDKGFFKSDKR